MTGSPDRRRRRRSPPAPSTAKRAHGMVPKSQVPVRNKCACTDWLAAGRHDPRSSRRVGSAITGVDDGTFAFPGLRRQGARGSAWLHAKREADALADRLTRLRNTMVIVLLRRVIH